MEFSAVLEKERVLCSVVRVACLSQRPADCLLQSSPDPLVCLQLNYMWLY